MPIKKQQDKTFCKYCGAQINQDAQFCKNCGKNFNEENGLIYRINSKINILAVLLGLVVTLIILFIGAGFIGVAIAGEMDVLLYVFLILFAMLFFGGLTTGITGCKSINEGLINGGILSLITFLLFGFMIGILAFISVAMLASIASAFSAFGTSNAASTTINIPTSSSFSMDGLFLIIKIIVIPIVSFFAGIGGGALGAWIMEVRR